MATETETAHEVAHVAATLADHLPILVVLIPFIAAPLVVIIGARGLAWSLALLASAASTVIAAVLLSKVMGGGVISYALGGWLPPLGIEYRIDAANAFVLLLVTAISTVVLLYAKASVAAEIPQKTPYVVLCRLPAVPDWPAGRGGHRRRVQRLRLPGDLVAVDLRADRAWAGTATSARFTAAYDYLIMGTIGATFFVIGIGFLYMATGTLNMADIADRIAEQGVEPHGARGASPSSSSAWG